jgi:hypothetical protein
MASPLSGSLAKAVYGGMKGLFLDATLIRTTPGTPDPATPWVEPEPTTVPYTCKAIVEQYSDLMVANGLVQVNDRKLLVLTQSLSVTPQLVTDTLTIRSVTYQLIGQVKTDPALAVWELQGRF